MKNKTEERIMFFALIFALLWMASLWTYNSFFNSQVDKPITFQIVGITNSTNATTISQIHFECIKFCGERMSKGAESQYKCYEQCATLGQEQCGGIR